MLLTQWGAATTRYVPSPLPPLYDVTLVGQLYGERGELVQGLRDAGIAVRTWGTGWSVNRWHRALGTRSPFASLGGARLYAWAQARSRCTQEEMIEIFGRSRININPTEASQGDEAQIKGRTFEVPACGGFLLTGHAQHLEDYYVPDEEIVVFGSMDELRDKVSYYLRHDEQRVAIARAGLRRTLAEHTYHRRLGDSSPAWVSRAPVQHGRRPERPSDEMRTWTRD